MKRKAAREWDVPRCFFAIYKITLPTAVLWVAYQLTEESGELKLFAKACEARKYAENWVPNKYLRGLFKVMEVCEPKNLDDRLDYWMQTGKKKRSQLSTCQSIRQPLERAA